MTKTKEETKKDFLSDLDYDKIRYEIVPPLFLVVFTVIAQLLVVLGNPDLRQRSQLKLFGCLVTPNSHITGHVGQIVVYSH